MCKIMTTRDGKTKEKWWGEGKIGEKIRRTTEIFNKIITYVLDM